VRHWSVTSIVLFWVSLILLTFVYQHVSRLMKRASGVMTGFEDDDRWGNHDDNDNSWGAPEREVDAAAFDTKEEAAMEAFVEEEVRRKLTNEKKAVQMTGKKGSLTCL